VGFGASIGVDADDNYAAGRRITVLGLAAAAPSPRGR
jgi:hypothetical protein